MIWRPSDEWSYSYLLGIYLGDGWLATSRPTANPYLVVRLDSLYPQIVKEVELAISVITMLYRPISVRREKSANCFTLQATYPHWCRAFPQHGPGKKHNRPIVLEPWQREILDRHPGRFLRGLIHSDGCRTVNRFKTKLPSGRVAEYENPRYFFLEHVGRHPRPVLRVLREAGDTVDAVEPPEHLGVAPRQRGAARIHRRDEDLRLVQAGSTDGRISP